MWGKIGGNVNFALDPQQGLGAIFHFLAKIHLGSIVDPSISLLRSISLHYKVNSSIILKEIMSFKAISLWTFSEGQERFFIFCSNLAFFNVQNLFNIFQLGFPTDFQTLLRPIWEKKCKFDIFRPGPSARVRSDFCNLGLILHHFSLKLYSSFGNIRP